MASRFEELTGRRFPEWMAASDPEGGVGSGGGTAWILAEAWRRESSGVSFLDWIAGGQRLIIHSGGKSRRLPEFAPQGKVFMPVPTNHGRGRQALRWLLDELVERGDDVFDAAAPQTKVVILAGDVRFGVSRVALPSTDVAVAGMMSTPDEAGRHGVFVTDLDGRVDRMLQKPSAAQLPQKWLLDIGIWGLSTRAVSALMESCGWNGEDFENGTPGNYDLYSGFGMDASGLGLSVGACEVDGEFIHLGTTEQYREHWTAYGGESCCPPLDDLPDEDHERFLQRQRTQVGAWVAALPTNLASILDLRQAGSFGVDFNVVPDYAHLMMQGRRDEAFRALSRTIVNEYLISDAVPVPCESAVRACAPLRLDLAGGWTDTPPFSLQEDAHVVNLAVEWGGSAPSEAMVFPCSGKDIEIVSTDRNQHFLLRESDDLPPLLSRTELPVIGLAALHLCGVGRGRFPGGMRLVMTSRAPEGSGLGASSILAATVLGALNSWFQLGWTDNDIVERTLWLEQLIGSHGGWQDQAGGVYPGLKLLTSGVNQMVDIKPLRDALIRDNPCVLLYNTGIQRRAFNVLGEIVEGMFLNDYNRLHTLREIGHHAVSLLDILERGTFEQFGRALRRSWNLNQRLDSGTNTPAIQRLLDPVEDLMHGGKLLGAGGGGFFFLAAKDEAAAAQIKTIWTGQNPAGQFIDWRIADRGLVVEPVI